MKSTEGNIIHLSAFIHKFFAFKMDLIFVYCLLLLMCYCQDNKSS